LQTWDIAQTCKLPLNSEEYCLPPQNFSYIIIQDLFKIISACEEELKEGKFKHKKGLGLVSFTLTDAQ
jgi:hypothetical protein